MRIDNKVMIPLTSPYSRGYKPLTDLLGEGQPLTKSQGELRLKG